MAEQASSGVGAHDDDDEQGDADPDDASDDPGCANDDYEPNQVAMKATALVWDEISSWNEDEFHDARVSVDAFLCPGEEDWYRVPIDELGFDDHILRIDGLVMGTSWCGHLEGCGGASLPDSPANTLAIEVYDAASMVQIAAKIASNGRVDVNGWSEEFGKDLVLRVYSPTAAASFAYALHVDVRSYDGEDECEC